MEVRKGYKRTEAGVIPDDWSVGTIGDLTIKVGSGITPTGGEKVYKTEGRPFMRSQNVGWGTLLLDDIAFIDEQTHSSFSATEIQLNDVLLNITGASIGRSAIADERIKGGNVNQHVCIIRVDTSRLSPKFINLFLLSQMGQKQIDSFQAGGNRQGLNFGQIKSFLFTLPPLPEQQAIAAALSDVDALLTALDALIVKKRLIKQGAMQELLTGKKRLPGFGGEWEKKKLEEIASFYSGSTPSTSNSSYYGGDIPWITSSDLNEEIILDVDGRITKLGLENSSAKMVDADTLLIALYGATAGVTAITKINAAINQAVLAIIPSKDNHVFLYYTLKFLKDWIITTYTQGGQPNLSGAIVKSIEISLPNPSEQTAIAEILSDMDAEISALESRREKTRLLKVGMMQELLTGRIRLV